MIQDLLAYGRLGFAHLTDPGGLDHVLFLLVLAAVHRPGRWMAAVQVVTAFTVGHTAALALAVLAGLSLPTAWVEFLIPVTIVLAGVENILRRGDAPEATALQRALVAAVFGLVHGMGFAGFLGSLLGDRVAVPLVGFNLGVEAAQLVVLAGAVAGLAVIDRILAAVLAPRAAGRRVFEIRAVALSALVTLVAAGWSIERWP